MNLENKIGRTIKGAVMGTGLAVGLSTSPMVASQGFDGPIEMTPEIQEQIERNENTMHRSSPVQNNARRVGVPYIPEFLVDTMFESLDRDTVERNIRFFNEYQDARENRSNTNFQVGSFIYSADVTRDRRFPGTAPPRFDGEEVIDNPAYWVLARAMGGRYGLSYNNMVLSAVGEHDHKSKYKISDDCTEHLARGLKNTPARITFSDHEEFEKEREEDLLNATYCFATGEDSNYKEHVENITSGRYKNLADGLVQEWEEEYDYSPFNDHRNHLLAYHIDNLPETPINSEGAGLSLYMLENFERNTTKEKKKNKMVYSITLNGKKEYPHYMLDDPETNFLVMPININQGRF